MEIVAFIVLSIAVVATPGPNVLVIISTSLSHGRRRGLQTVMGTSIAMIVQLAIAAVGTSVFVSHLSHGFMWLKWAGVIYLCYLGCIHFYKAFSGEMLSKSSASGSFQKGFWVSLTNPKTIIFFSAFLPQFMVGSSHYLQQVILLSCIFWVIAVLIDSAYAILAARLSRIIRREKHVRYQNVYSGTLYMTASALLSRGQQ